LIEKVRTNLALQSNSFSTLPWGNINSSQTSGQAGYDGTNNAWSLIEDSSTGVHVNAEVPATFGFVTISVYAKAGTRNWLFLRGVQASSNVRAWFNLSTGTIGTVETNGLAKIESIGNGWYRCSLSLSNFESGFESYIGIASADNTASYAGNGTGNIFIQNYQREAGDIATPYIPTTTAAVSVGPVANIPRIDYTGGGCGKLLLEPQRTNLVTFSEQFDNAAYTKINATITANTAVSPDGFTNADTLSNVNSVDQSILRAGSFSITANVGSTYTTSIFVKKGTANFLRVRNLFVQNGGDFGNAWFNLNTGIVGTVESSQVATMQNYGNGWYRCTLSGVVGSSNNFNFVDISLSNTDNSLVPSTSVNLLVYGAQLEAGSYPTSYIPTLGASVTRSADSASKTGISSLIGATEGTIYGEFTFTGISPQMHMFVSVAGSFANAVYVQTFSATGISMQVWNGVVNQVAINSSGLTAGQNVKFAAAYKANDFALYVNGVQVGTDTSGSVPSGLSQLEVGGYAEAGSPFNFNSSIQTAALYPVRLTNAELATLTSL
jgi:hypothetical protein